MGSLSHANSQVNRTEPSRVMADKAFQSMVVTKAHNKANSWYYFWVASLHYPGESRPLGWATDFAVPDPRTSLRSFPNSCLKNFGNFPEKINQKLVRKPPKLSPNDPRILEKLGLMGTKVHANSQLNRLEPSRDMAENSFA